MYHSNSSAVPGHELPSEAKRSHDWRGVIDWKNSSCWWNQGEDYCGKSSSLVSVRCPQEPWVGLSGDRDSQRGCSLNWERQISFHIQVGKVCRGAWGSCLCLWLWGKGWEAQALCQDICVGLAQFHLHWQNRRWLMALTGCQSCLLCQITTVQSPVLCWSACFRRASSGDLTQSL